MVFASLSLALAFGLFWPCLSDNIFLTNDDGTDKSLCYHQGKAQRCQPSFVNAAFGRRVHSTNTCGEERTVRYCSITQSQVCDFCVMGDPYRQHPTTYLTDFNNVNNETWWQSETMLEDVQYPNQVNITLDLGKAFDITYVRLKFKSPRPESFAIYKKTTSDGPWEPFQYYSSSCRDTYGLPDLVYLPEGSEDRAVCTSEFTDIVPLTGGLVAFATLEGRPGGLHFDYSASLQRWVTATAVRITLQRLNTFGDEVFRDPSVLQAYYYAITDLAVGGTCKCNGHAARCVSYGGESRGPEDPSTEALSCECQHNTDGVDCEKCLPFYNDLPWKRATPRDAQECRACNCNGFSKQCFFDQDLYSRTGHGGHCTNCSSNRDGVNCEHCLANHFEQTDGYCTACNCHPQGSRSPQCNSNGVCTCKPGVGGVKCDHCLANFYNFNDQGCTPCNCMEKGSLDNQATCDPVTGLCTCKANVEGQMCDRCKPGYFALSSGNVFGCTACFCHGHSSVCRSADGYSEVMLNTEFLRGHEGWTAEDYQGTPFDLSYRPLLQSIHASSSKSQPVYFIAPSRYLGDQRASYNQDLVFTLRIGEHGPEASVHDVVLQGSGLEISLPIFGQGNPLPEKTSQEYMFRLHEDSEYGWIPKMRSLDFVAVLSNLTSIKIRASYTAQGHGYLESFALVSARRGQLGRSADWIESCQCPHGYVGQFCESCQPRYHHEARDGGAFSRCVPCNCNGHADICDASTGKCICQHNTAGENCQVCTRGFYGNALMGKDDDCKPCPCPDQGPCMELEDGEVVCLECPVGYTGHRCEICTDGWFGQPPMIPCQLCDCNENVDKNAVGNCNHTTAECVKCLYNTAGFYCDRCQLGYFGDPLALPKGNCRSCNCNPVATLQSEQRLDTMAPLLCDQLSGQCQCKPFVTGVKCERCLNGYWNINSGHGCEECGCDVIGAYNASCDVETGQCFCRPGVVGEKCDRCDANMYDFSLDGCQHCHCDAIGSLQLQCNTSGLCTCRENVEGSKCDRCKENKYDRQSGCKECPACYSLVQDAVSGHRDHLQQLTHLLGEVNSGVDTADANEFQQKLTVLTESVSKLYDQSAAYSGATQRTPQQLMSDMQDRLLEISKDSDEIQQLVGRVRLLGESAGSSMSETDKTVGHLHDAITSAIQFLDTEGAHALSKAVDRSRQFGYHSRQMTRMAREARQLAVAHQSIADALLYDADSSVANATAAYNRAYQIIEQQRNFSEILRQLEIKINDLQIKMVDTENQANQARREANLAYETSLSIYTEAKAIGDQRSIEPLQDRSEQLQIDTELLVDEVQRLTADLDPMADQLSADVSKVQRLLRSAQLTEKVAEQLVKDISAAKDQAERAVSAGDATLDEAQRTLSTLRHFDSQVQRSRDLATGALQQVADTGRVLHSGEQRTARATSSLGAANASASAAAAVILQAKRLALQVNSSSSSVAKQWQVARQQCDQLLQAGDELDSKLADTETLIITTSDSLKGRKASGAEVLLNASKARAEAAALGTQLQESLSVLSEMQSLLSAAGDIDSASVEQLERRLELAEQLQQQEQLNDRLQTLRQFGTEQQRKVRERKEQLSLLIQEVDNVEQIAASLPDKCYTRLKLEP